MSHHRSAQESIGTSADSNATPAGSQLPRQLPPQSTDAPDPISRRAWLSTAALAATAFVAGPLVSQLAAQGVQPSIPTAMTVFKSPTCGCCSAWVEHVTKAGFKCTVRDVEDLRIVKQTLGIPASLESCHTAQIGSYLVEGHVPADLIVKLLTEKPAGRGLAVPGMPVGSPGMEGGTPERYQILLFSASGAPRVYATRG